MENFPTILEELASRVLLDTHLDHFVFWSPDNNSSSFLLQHPQTEILRFKLALGYHQQQEEDSLSLETVCFFCDYGKPELVTLGRYSGREGLAIFSPYEAVFPDF